MTTENPSFVLPEAPAENGLSIEMFWYVAAESRELTPGRALGRTILDERLALFRDGEGRPVALQDRCLHRAGKLSKGRVVSGCLECPYHGWTYDAEGKVRRIPSMSESGEAPGSRSGPRYETLERDGFVYVRLKTPPEAIEPFAMPHWGEKGWRRVRLQNRFSNDVTNCAENFVDIPHTAFVHPVIFRSPRRQKLGATVERSGGSVRVRYRGETDNLGVSSWFLNPSGREIEHTDTFHMPNVTTVVYRFGPRRVFIITSQSVPVSARETLVYTDLTYDYGVLNPVAGPFVRWLGQKVIDQDVEVLRDQDEVIRKYGARFSHSPADVIHVFIESIRAELEAGRDPRRLPERREEIAFWV